LNEDLLEARFLQNPPVGDAVERHATGQTQTVQTGFTVHVGRQLDHDLLHDLLAGMGDVIVELREVRLGLALRLPEQRAPAVAEAPRRGVGVCKVAQVEPYAAVLFDVDDPAEPIHVFGRSVRCHAHDLPLGIVDPESEIGRDGTEQQADGMREANLLDRLDGRSSSDTPTRRRPFAHAVGGDDRRLVKRRDEKRAGRVGEVVLTKQDFLIDAEGLLDLPTDVQALSQP